MAMQRIWSEVFGCSHNRADTELMNGILVDAGFSLVTNPDEADMFLINSCTVKDPSEHHAINVVSKLLDKGLSGIFAGCVAQSSKLPDKLEKSIKSGKLAILGTSNCHRVADAAKELQGGVSSRFVSEPSKALPELTRYSRAPLSPYVTVVPVSSGCLCRCTYCKTVSARGRLRSEPLEEIIKCAARAQPGEVWLVGEDVGAWGAERASAHDAKPACLSMLLSELVPTLPTGCMLRIGMTNPHWVARELDAVCAQLNRPGVFKFLHLPVQSAADTVLRRMCRPYTAARFTALVNGVRARVPGVTISTDFIVGFPGETDEEFAATLRMAEELRFDIANISHFYARHGTPAKDMPGRVPTHIVKSRSRTLTRAVLAGFRRDRFVGARFRTLITEFRERPRPTLCARTPGYLQIVIPAPDGDARARLGSWVEVVIVRGTRVALEGRIVRTATPGPIETLP
eukprot:gnl/Chilomastix_cuspidata/1754.p1 GENE.gnl/Chilomastix_cuspidata/1754~~gnl/Chilomastix_cuspidata/1754.p1  ORF type:complete len:457 (-),score=29.49 gnl/Chilomastix_cuspidata/1754:16-1386(-)